MQKTQADHLYKSLIKAIAFAAVVIILLWILLRVKDVLLIFLFAVLFAIIINAPVSWLEKRKIKRGIACAIVFTSIFLIFGLLGWLIFPKIYQQLQALIENLPSYLSSFSNTIYSWVDDYPELGVDIKEKGSDISKWLPSASNMLTQIRNYSVSILGMLFMTILFVCIVVYILIKPRPLLKIYYSFFAEDKREKAQNALVHTSNMLLGWIRANIIAGSIEAVCVTTFLSIMNVPGAWVWGALALFAELIPNLGFYIMSIPPIIVAFTVSPMTALWVLVFFVVLNEIMADIVMPKLISSTMNIHPVSTLFMLLVMGSAFGLIGALLTVPVTAIIKAYYNQFNQKNIDDKELDKRIDKVVYAAQSNKKFEEE